MSAFGSGTVYAAAWSEPAMLRIRRQLAMSNSAVMQRASLWQAAALLNYIDEPDCSPNPFDIMAIYALYQMP